MKTNILFRYSNRLILAGILLFGAGVASTLHAQPWSVQGSDIEGAEADDNMGSAMDVNADGSIIVTSSPNNDGPFISNDGLGQVRAFQFDGFNWNQLGASIYGAENQDYLGTSVSMSANANFIAIGAAYSDGADGTVTDAGHVRLYQRVGSFWVQLGSLHGAAPGDHFGQSVSLSSDGLTLAVGADQSDAGGSDAGQTTVYFLNGINLVQLGSAINGVAAGDFSGYSVSLSDDGSTVAIGSYGADNSTPVEVGHVRVFAWNGVSWVQRGIALEGDDVNDNFGISVSLNDDGSILAAGSSTHGNGTTDVGLVRTYQWSGGAWSQIGSDILGGTNQRLGASVSLDSDGNTMLIGAIGNTSTAGHMRVYEWLSPNWVQQGGNLLGKDGFDGYGRGASISGDGAIFVGGSEQDRGYVRVYGPCENIGIDTIEACETYTWIDGATYTASNYTATHTVTNAAGCDSVVTLNLTILESNNGTDVITACDSYTWIDGNTYTVSNNTATHTLTNVAGCDSVVTLDLTISYSNTGTDVITACDSHTWIDGNNYTESNNTATHTLTNVSGCDSVVTLDLTISHSNTGTDVITACDSHTWIDGNNYTESNNTATHTLTNVSGCDSVVTLNLTILESNTGTDVVEECDSYTWIDGNTYTVSNNTATHTLTNVAGCDSVVTLNLTILESNTGIDVIQSCIPYTWIDGVTYSVSNNTATHNLINLAGCDSVVTLNLSIVDSYETTDVITACESYTWIDGVTYSESNNTATETLTSTAGCDSIVSLNLTIGHPNTGTDVISACDSHTWIDGLTYSSNNSTATHTLTNLAGCDSVVTLNLSILKSSAGTDVHTACDSLIWIDGVTYKASNSIATHILTNAVGCDSLVTLDLTILASTASTLDETGQVSYISPSGKIWTESGTYNDTIPNTAGCDSVITVNLTIIISGIEDYMGNQHVKYYPNPVDQELTIEFEQEFTGIVEVLDMNGRILLQERRSNSLRTKLNTSDLIPGTYLLKITGDKENYLLRIIKY